MGHYPLAPSVEDLRDRGRIFRMSKKFSEEAFQGFIVEQFGKLTTEIAEVRTEFGDVRRDVAGLQTGLADARGEIATMRVEMQTGFRELRTEIEEIKGILEPLANAFDRDAETIVEHDRLIGRLEEHVGIPKHA